MTHWYYQKYIDRSYIYHTAINNIADLNFSSVRSSELCYIHFDSYTFKMIFFADNITSNFNKTEYFQHHSGNLNGVYTLFAKWR